MNNLLSFGAEPFSLKLSNLNVLIGPNASGKSNLIEVLSLLRATPVSAHVSNADMRGVVRYGGGVQSWLFQGDMQRRAGIGAAIQTSSTGSLAHWLALAPTESGFLVENEEIKQWRAGKSKPVYPSQAAQALENLQGPGWRRTDTYESVLSRLRDAKRHPELTSLSDAYTGIRIFREWEFGRSSKLRNSQATDHRNDRLEEDFSNLGVFLSRMKRFPSAKRSIVEGLRDLYDGFTDFDVVIEGGRAQIYFTEGNYTVPATRLSDGTLRYLCLLTILCDPTPPPLICIEEPELGLHPDIIPKLTDRLIEASTRTQIIVTTHSDILVDAMSETPESVVICEKQGGVTAMNRLSSDALAEWLEKYRLGQLWMQGQIGGTRW